MLRRRRAPAAAAETDSGVMCVVRQVHHPLNADSSPPALRAHHRPLPQQDLWQRENCAHQRGVCGGWVGGWVEMGVLGGRGRHVPQVPVRSGRGRAAGVVHQRGVCGEWIRWQASAADASGRGAAAQRCSSGSGPPRHPASRRGLSSPNPPSPAPLPPPPPNVCGRTLLAWSRVPPRARAWATSSWQTSGSATQSCRCWRRRRRCRTPKLLSRCRCCRRFLRRWCRRRR